MKQFLALVGAAVLGAVFSQIAVQAAYADHSPPWAQVLRTERIEFVDAGGNARAMIEVGKDGRVHAIGLADLGASPVSTLPAPVTPSPIAHGGYPPAIHSGYGELGNDVKAEVAKVVSHAGSQVQACYELALRTNPEEGGKVTVHFRLGTAALVTEVFVIGAQGTFAACIKQKFLSIRGLPLVSTPTEFTQSYVFTKGG